MLELTPLEAFVRSQFRETRGAAGQLLFLDHAQEDAILEGLPLVEVP